MELTSLLNELDQLFADKKLTQVEPFLLSNIEKASIHGEPGIQLALLNELMGFYRSIGAAKKAIDVSVTALALIQSLHLEQTAEHATTLLNTATAFRADHRNQEALAFYHQALNIYDRTIGEQDARRASLYNNMSQAYQELGQYEQAAQCLMHALSIIQTIPGGETETAITYSNLAALYLDSREFSKAVSYLECALKIFEQGRKHDAHYCAALALKAQCYYLMKDYGNSITAYTQALQEILSSFGPNESFAITCSNCAMVLEDAGFASQAQLFRDRAAKTWKALSVSSFRSGLEISRLYYETCGKPMLQQQFPDYEDRIAVGLAGHGSECFGFDDELSTDHDYGPSFCMWLTDEDYEVIGTSLQHAYDNLPGEFLGYPARQITDHGTNRIGVLKISDFYREFLGTSHIPLTISQWCAIAPHALACASNGQVFADKAGHFSAVREYLKKGYPREVLILRLAESVTRLSQAGQYNYSRCLKRNDSVAASMALAQFTEQTLAAAYLLNNQYMPYYKWAAKGLKNLPVLSDLHPLLNQIAALSPDQSDRIIPLIETICEKILQELQKQHFTTYDRFPGDDFLANHTDMILKSKGEK